jgi:hypothetical protein
LYAPSGSLVIHFVAVHQREPGLRDTAALRERADQAFVGDLPEPAERRERGLRERGGARLCAQLLRPTRAAVATPKRRRRHAPLRPMWTSASDELCGPVGYIEHGLVVSSSVGIVGFSNRDPSRGPHSQLRRPREHGLVLLDAWVVELDGLPTRVSAACRSPGRCGASRSRRELGGGGTEFVGGRHPWRVIPNHPWSPATSAARRTMPNALTDRSLGVGPLAADQHTRPPFSGVRRSSPVPLNRAS